MDVNDYRELGDGGVVGWQFGRAEDAEGGFLVGVKGDVLADGWLVGGEDVGGGGEGGDFEEAVESAVGVERDVEVVVGVESGHGLVM